MKIPEPMLNDMMTAVMAMLPYEVLFKPHTAEGQVVLDLFDIIDKVFLEGISLEGPVCFQIKRIESSPERIKQVRTMVIEVHKAIEIYLEKTK